MNMNINFGVNKMIKKIRKIFTQSFTSTGVKSYVSEDLLNCIC